MGLFDSLKKLGEDLGKEIEKGVNSEAFKSVKDTLTNVGASVSNNVSQSREIPQEYMGFPKFRETVKNLSTKETPNYTRCTMDFSNVSQDEVDAYTNQLIQLGYVKNTAVRYDKENTYIIVDYAYGELNLVFHIKK
jgi:hypothetical protein